MSPCIKHLTSTRRKEGRWSPVRIITRPIKEAPRQISLLLAYNESACLHPQHIALTVNIPENLSCMLIMQNCCDTIELSPENRSIDVCRHNLEALYLNLCLLLPLPDRPLCQLSSNRSIPQCPLQLR